MRSGHNTTLVVIEDFDYVAPMVDVSPLQSELLPSGMTGQQVNALYERAKEQERVEHWLSRAQQAVLRERQQRREPRRLEQRPLGTPSFICQRHTEVKARLPSRAS